MGLDITAYNGVKPVDPELYKDVDPETDELYEMVEENYWFTPWIDDSFPRHAGNMKDQIPHTFDNEICFRAGSYGSYNQWRNQLAIVAGYDSAEDLWKLWEQEDLWGKPFAELINFSDCEGVIGTELCNKLREDFKKHRDFASMQADVNGWKWFMETYDDFMNALEFAGDNGVLVFH